MGQLAAGAKTLKDGTVQLASGGQELASGASELTEGAETLKDGMAEMDSEGIRKIADVFSGDLEELLSRLEDEVTADGQYRVSTERMTERRTV